MSDRWDVSRVYKRPKAALRYISAARFGRAHAKNPISRPKPDIAKARQLLTKSCDAGLAQACEVLKSTPKSRARIRTWIRRP